MRRPAAARAAACAITVASLVAVAGCGATPAPKPYRSIVLDAPALTASRPAYHVGQPAPWWTRRHDPPARRPPVEDKPQPATVRTSSRSYLGGGHGRVQDSYWETRIVRDRQHR